MNNVTLKAPELTGPQIADYSTFLNKGPLGMYQSDADRYQPIPAALEPLVFPEQDWDELRDQSADVLSALQKVAVWLQDGQQSKMSQVVFAGLEGLELEASQGRAQAHSGSATCRLDLFFEKDDVKVIEINATIPAMQAYSDMVKKAYLSAAAGAEVELEQSNSFDLLSSLLQHYEKSGGRKSRPRIGIIARPGDSQLAELLWLQAEWTRWGFETLLGHPDEVVAQNGALRLGSIDVDLFYRHIFAYRLDPKSVFAKACLESQTFKIFNPISAHLEAKGLMAELSRIAADPMAGQELGLSEAEMHSVSRRLVWSRLLMAGPSISAEGEVIEDMRGWARSQQTELVIKSSLGYGGLGVFFGSDFESSISQARVQKYLGLSSPLSWAEFVDFCMDKKPGHWIIQKKLEGLNRRMKFISNGLVRELNVFVDSSIFVNSGVERRPRGGACRFSEDSIVNLGRGGGLIPLLSEGEAKSRGLRNEIHRRREGSSRL